MSEMHGLDTESAVYFYEQDFYPLSNFSSFSLLWNGRRFPTSEHAYHWEKFYPGTRDGSGVWVRDEIMNATSAHEAFKLAEGWIGIRRPDWDKRKVSIMRDILRAKAAQHEYVRRKLLATGTRTLIENSWRDSFWGWGPKGDGENWLGLLWMEIRTELALEGNMTDIDKRCGTCRYFTEKGGGLCMKTPPTILPQWARLAIEDADEGVEPSDGTGCDAWEAMGSGIDSEKEWRADRVMEIWGKTRPQIGYQPTHSNKQPIPSGDE